MLLVQNLVRGLLALELHFKYITQKLFSLKNMWLLIYCYYLYTPIIKNSNFEQFKSLSSDTVKAFFVIQKYVLDIYNIYISTNPSKGKYRNFGSFLFLFSCRLLNNVPGKISSLSGIPGLVASPGKAIFSCFRWA